MKGIKYYTALIINVLSLCVMIATFGFLLYEMLTSNHSINVGMSSNKKIILLNQEILGIKIWQLLIGIIGIGQYVILRFPLKKFLNSALLDYEYDEFGNSKKKSFENLTRKEREQIDLQKMADMERILSSSVLKKIEKVGSKEPEKEFEKLIGITNVKQKIREMEARFKFDKSKKISLDGTHYCFLGNAGTGKTSVCRIMTGIFYKYGCINKNKIIEVDGNFFECGNETATKTKAIIQRAYDGVLFIDEAYTLSETAIATIIKEMEDNRDKFILVLAGYTKEMNQMLEKNSGFKSRIKEYWFFDDYDNEDCKRIFSSMANEKGFVVSAEALDNLCIRLNKERQISGYGNARTVRNILDESIDKHALNFLDKKIEEEDKFKICECDVSVIPKRLK